MLAKLLTASGLAGLAVIVTFSPPAFADTGAVATTAVGPLSESAALDGFRRENLELVAERYNVSAQRAQTIAAGVWPNPVLGVGGAFLIHGAATGGKQELTVSLTQVVPIAGQVSARRDAAEAYANAAERDFAAVTWFLAMEVRKRYLDVRVNQERVKLWRSALTDFAKVETVIDSRAQAGANPVYDRLRVSVERRTLAGRATEADADLIASRAALAQILGSRAPASSLEVQEDLPDVPDGTVDVDGIVKRAVTQRPDLTAARLRLSAAELQITALKRSYIPAPEIGAGYTHAFNVPAGPTGVNGGMIAVQLGIPLPIFDHGQGTIDRGRAEAEIARARSRSAEWQVRRDAEAAALVYRTRATAWRAFRDSALPDAERVRQIAELSYKEGRASILELLDAYRAHLETRIRAVDLRGSAARSGLDLARSLCRGLAQHHARRCAAACVTAPCCSPWSC